MSRSRRVLPRMLARLRLWRRRLLTLLAPPLLTGLLLWAIALVFDRQTATELLVISLASWFWMGTTVVLAPAVLGQQIHLVPWDIALWMIWLNTAAAFFYAFNLDLLEKLPWIGPPLRRTRQRARVSLELHPWIRRLAAPGVGLFVLTPFPGSGQLGGCFVGRLLGLSRRTVFLVVTLAGAIVAVLYGKLGSWTEGVLNRHHVGVWVRIGGALVLVGGVWLVVHVVRRLGRESDDADATARV